MIHKLPLRVYYEDTDAGGIVFYANYLKFAERGRTEFLRALGFENSGLAAAHNVLLVVRHIEADYLKPAKLDDMLELRTSVTGLAKVRMEMRQEIFHNDVKIFDMKVVLVAINMDGRPCPIPDEVADKLKGVLTIS
ncbi:MAG: tol-pal system-associated acyl-CoA thioesterase [Alphaproteobacteria bacterium]|nr:tol-pal system-associated acyl-CoA thioesterase [Alphaproteobacteria bacterium]